MVVVVVQSSGPGGQNPSQTLVTPDTVRELAQLPGVVSVIPRDYIYGGTLINYKRLEGYPGIIGVDLADLSVLGLQPISGTLELEKGTAIIGARCQPEFLRSQAAPGAIAARAAQFV